MFRWQADPALATLIQRYYAGEAGLWGAIRAEIDAHLRAQGQQQGAFHIRLRRRHDGYEIQIDDASAYATEA
jgi:hypothetical protein